MEASFSNLFKDIRYERSFNLLLSLTDPDIIKQIKITDDEIIVQKIWLLRYYTDKNV